MHDLDRNALDRHITGGRYSEEDDTAFCHNRACKAYGEEQDVLVVREYGQSYWQPDECSHCFGEWHEQAPEEDDDDE